MGLQQRQTCQTYLCASFSFLSGETSIAKACFGVHLRIHVNDMSCSVTVIHTAGCLKKSICGQSRALWPSEVQGRRHGDG